MVRKNRIISVILAAVMLLALLPGCAKKSAKEDTDAITVRKRAEWIVLDILADFVYNPSYNQIGQFVTILSVNKTRDLQSDGRILRPFCFAVGADCAHFSFLEERI